MIDIYAYEELNQEHIFLQDNHASDFFLRNGISLCIINFFLLNKHI